MTARPRLRGLLHQYAFFASLLALPVLILVSPTGRAIFTGTVYGLSFVALFGVSALFHRITWSERARRWMGRLDHATINVAIAGSFTPFGLLALSGPVATVCMVVVWGGALGGLLLHVLCDGRRLHVRRARGGRRPAGDRSNQVTRSEPGILRRVLPARRTP